MHARPAAAPCRARVRCAMAPRSAIPAPRRAPTPPASRPISPRSIISATGSPSSIARFGRIRPSRRATCCRCATRPSSSARPTSANCRRCASSCANWKISACRASCSSTRSTRRRRRPRVAGNAAAGLAHAAAAAPNPDLAERHRHRLHRSRAGARLRLPRTRPLRGGRRARGRTAAPKRKPATPCWSARRLRRRADGGA